MYYLVDKSLNENKSKWMKDYKIVFDHFVNMFARQFKQISQYYKMLRW